MQRRRAHPSGDTSADAAARPDGAPTVTECFDALNKGTTALGTFQCACAAFHTADGARPHARSTRARRGACKGILAPCNGSIAASDSELLAALRGDKEPKNPGRSGEQAAQDLHDQEELTLAEIERICAEDPLNDAGDSGAAGAGDGEAAHGEQVQRVSLKPDLKRVRQSLTAGTLVSQVASALEAMSVVGRKAACCCKIFEPLWLQGGWQCLWRLP